MSRTLRSIAPVLILLVVFSAGSAFAMPLPGQSTLPHQAGLLDALFGWFGSLFVATAETASDSAANLWDKAGWEMDPNGLFLMVKTDMAPPSPTAGWDCEVDPKGCL
jgi:hypothetical protein